MRPAPTALVHFVCTRWPGSDGRKIGMRLLRKWYTADIAWARGSVPQAEVRPPVYHFVGFAHPIPLGDTYRTPAARCRAPTLPEGAEPCGVDKNPQSGTACRGAPSTMTVCGLCGILSDSSYPTGAALAQ